MDFGRSQIGSNSPGKGTVERIVEFRDFSFRYGNRSEYAVHHINLSITAGEIVLIGGISGSGKSTLCHAIAGQIPLKIKGYMGGSIHLFGKDIWDYTQEEISQKICYMFQNADEQLVTFTVFDEIAFLAENLNQTKEEIQARVKQIVNMLGISHLLYRSIYSLSGGEKQKIILAANLVLIPQLVILDEPLAFLDAEGEALLVTLLETYHQQFPNTSFVIIEHRLVPFKSLVNRIVLLNFAGEIQFDGSLVVYQEYIQHTETKFLRDLSKSPVLSVASTSASHINNTISIGTSGTVPLIKMEHVAFAYPNNITPVFIDLNVDFYPGEFIGIRGKNGSGKTTLLYLITRMLLPQQGQIWLKGVAISEIPMSTFLPQIGFIFQNPENQIFESTIQDEILYGPRNFAQMTQKHGFFSLISKKSPKNIEPLDEFGIYQVYLPLIQESRIDETRLAQTHPFWLSWGQKRRLNLASIFSYNPDILLIDEPFIGQDASAVDRIFQILHKFNQQGKMIILVSHDHDLLQSHCSRILDIADLDSKHPTQPISTSISRKSAIQTPSKRLTRIHSYLTQSWYAPQRQSWLNRLNPMAKFVMMLCFTIALFYQRSILVYIACYISVLVIMKSAHISVLQSLRQLRWIVILTIIYVPINTLFDAQRYMTDDILFYIGSSNWPVYRLALYYSIRTGLLIMLLISIAVIFTRTTPPKDLVYSLIGWHIPYRYAFSFMIGLRYVPLIQHESNTIEIAQTLRGAGVKKGSTIKQIYRHILHRLTTLLIATLRKVYTTATTIEMRGFGVHPTRTNLYSVPWRKRDFIFLLLGILLLFFFVAFQQGIFPLPFSIPSLYSIYLHILSFF